MNVERAWSDARWMTIVRVIAILVLGGMMVRLAWLGDDALITLRAALNVTHGWGAGFNATESVQAYTHPLWFLVWAGIGSLTGEWILTILLAGVLFSLGAVALVLWSARSRAVIVAAALAFAFSDAFMEYTTSGLENPLAWLLIGAFVILVSKAMTAAPGSALTVGRSILIGLLAAAIVLTRFDLALIVAPVALVLAWHARRNGKAIAAAALAAAAPVILWFGWSWVTYGSLLPNTFLAKQNLDIPKIELVVQGFRYAWVTADFDPFTALVIVAGLVIIGMLGTALQRATAAGVVLYLAYIVYIGGDFMAGRFFAVPFYVVVLTIVLMTVSTPAQRDAGHAEAAGRSASVATVAVVVSVAVILVGLAAANRTPTAFTAPNTARWANEQMANIYDARGKFMELNKGLGQALMALGQPTVVPPFMTDFSVDPIMPLRDIRAAANMWPQADEAPLARSEWPSADGTRYTVPTKVGVTCGLLGAWGILSGPTVHWIDTCALADRFLAGLPAQGRDFHWVIGHFGREVPAGYTEAVSTGDPSKVTDPVQRQRLIDLWAQIRR